VRGWPLARASMSKSALSERPNAGCHTSAVSHRSRAANSDARLGLDEICRKPCARPMGRLSRGKCCDPRLSLEWNSAQLPISCKIVEERGSADAQPEHYPQNAYRTGTSYYSEAPVSSTRQRVSPRRRHPDPAARGKAASYPGRGLDQFREPQWATSAKLPSCGLACAMAARASLS
jgi:hypothetical protein